MDVAQLIEDFKVYVSFVYQIVKKDKQDEQIAPTIKDVVEHENYVYVKEVEVDDLED